MRQPVYPVLTIDRMARSGDLPALIVIVAGESLYASHRLSTFGVAALVLATIAARLLLPVLLIRVLPTRLARLREGSIGSVDAENAPHTWLELLSAVRDANWHCPVPAHKVAVERERAPRSLNLTLHAVAMAVVVSVIAVEWISGSFVAVGAWRIAILLAIAIVGLSALFRVTHVWGVRLQEAEYSHPNAPSGVLLTGGLILIVATAFLLA